jgi:hypothetical protein
VLSPVLAATEFGMLAVAAKQRWLGGKLGGWWWLAGHAGWLRRHRRETQSLRRVPDRDLAAFLTPTLDPGMLHVPRVVSIGNGLLAAYWRLVRRAL